MKIKGSHILLLAALVVAYFVFVKPKLASGGSLF